MSGGGGGTTTVQPSTTTTVQDIPAWEQGYVTDLLGQSQAEAAQPYQQFPGQQVAGFTPDQTQSFSNIEGQQSAINPLQTAATGQSAAGSNTANSIYGVGAGDINASTMAASPMGIQAYMSPYTNSVVQGLQNTANQNWNQNIMPSVNNEFVGSGQYGSGRNAQVLGQAANNFQTNLNTGVANALESGYTTAGNQAATEAGLLGSAGTSLGNLAATQGNEQLSAGTNLQNLASAQNTNALTNNQALQAVGQEQQQLNQSNLNTAQQNFENQVNYPEQQSAFLNAMIRGLPAPTATTSASQSPAYSVSPLSGIGGAGVGALALSGTNGTPLGTAQSAKTGGLIKGYADGGSVDDYDNQNSYDYPLQVDSGDMPSAVPLDAANAPPAPVINPLDMQDTTSDDSSSDDNASISSPSNPLAPPVAGIPPAQTQQLQLLALAKGLLTPQINGSPMAALGTGFGNLADVSMKTAQMQNEQNNLNYQRQMEAKRLDIQQQRADQMDQYHKDYLASKSPYEFRKDAQGNNVAYDKQTGQPVNGAAASTSTNSQLTGDDYLKSIPSLRASEAKAASEGRVAITPFLLKTPYGQQLLSDTMQYDPSYDVAASPARVATRKDFTSGPSSKNITSLNTALGHAAGWMDSAAALNNTNHDWLNYAENTVKSADSYPQLKSFNDKADALADELTRTFRGTGGSVTEVQNWRKNLSPNMSPEEQKASAAALSDLLDSRLDALGATYTRGMGKSVDPSSFLTPKGKAAYNKIHGTTDTSNVQSEGNPPAAPVQSDRQAALLAELARKGAQ